MKSISKEALLIGVTALSGPIDELLKKVPKHMASRETLGYALDVLEHHAEKQFTSRKILEAGEIASIES